MGEGVSDERWSLPALEYIRITAQLIFDQTMGWPPNVESHIRALADTLPDGRIAFHYPRQVDEKYEMAFNAYGNPALDSEAIELTVYIGRMVFRATYPSEVFIDLPEVSWVMWVRDSLAANILGATE